jgi:4-amino-4-deoxy-L-arabinose transferase-like glycosyltransferase
LTAAEPDPRGARRRDLAVLALVSALLFLPGLGRRDLWNPDEPRYGEVAREMVESGEYVVPHFNGRLYTQKPPLMFWAMALAGFVLGDLDETAVRLPSALAAIGCVLLVYGLGHRLFDRRSAWLAAIVFATCSKVLWQARFGQIDMLLTFLVLSGVCCWMKGRLDGRHGWSYAFFAFAALATIAKGPVGLLPPLLAILAFLALTWDGRGFRDLRLAQGLLLWWGVVVLWLAPAIALGGDPYWRDIVLRQNVTRYVNPWGHYQPPWYFLQVLPVDFLPWSLFVPAAVVGGGALDRERRRHLLFLACWVVVTVLFFSVSPGKRTVYVLTCYPALALLTGAGLAALSRRAPSERSRVGWLAWPAAGFAVLLWVVAFAAPRATRWVEVPAFATPLLAPTAIGIGALAAAATVAFAFAWRRRVVPMVATLALGLALTTVALFVWLLPKLDSELSLRSLAGVIATRLPSGYTLASYHEMEGGLLFYGAPFAREIRDPEELRSLLAEPNGVWLVVDPDDRGGLTWPLDLPVVARQNESEDSVIVFASRPGAAPPDPTGDGPAP